MREINNNYGVTLTIMRWVQESNLQALAGARFRGVCNAILPTHQVIATFSAP